MMKKIISIFIMIMLLTSCSKKTIAKESKKSSKTITVCLNNFENYTSKQTYESKNDIISNILLETETNYANSSITNEDLLFLSEQSKKILDIKGVKYKSNVEKRSIKQTIEINAQDANLDELIKVGILYGNEDNNIMSLKETIEELDKQNIKCHKTK